MAKLTPRLEQRLRHAAPGDLVDIVIEVVQAAESPPQTTRAARHDASANEFGVWTKALTDLIDSVGGKVLGSSWLASAIKAQIPAESIERLQAEDNVEVIDLPRQLTRG